MQKQTQLLFGVGGWEHETYDRCFYPTPNANSLDKLEFYSRFFDTVEVRATFWDETLSASDVRAWMGAVAANKKFVFNVKLHSSFTHKRQLNPDLAAHVRSLLEALAKEHRLGALVVQVPYSFTNTSVNRLHLAKIGDMFKEHPVFVETRHASWNHPALLNFMSEQYLHPVNADFPRLKNFMPFTTGIIGDVAYIRMHGRNEKGWLVNDWDARYDYLYNAKEMHEMERRLMVLTQKCERIIVIFNNTTFGKAIANAFQLNGLVAGRRCVQMPDACLRVFPQLRERAGSPRSHQLFLPQLSGQSGRFALGKAG